MNNKTKMTKTILFTVLITVMLLPVNMIKVSEATNLVDFYGIKRCYAPMGFTICRGQ